MANIYAITHVILFIIMYLINISGKWFLWTDQFRGGHIKALQKASFREAICKQCDASCNTVVQFCQDLNFGFFHAKFWQWNKRLPLKLFKLWDKSCSCWKKYDNMSIFRPHASSTVGLKIDPSWLEIHDRNPQVVQFEAKINSFLKTLFPGLTNKLKKKILKTFWLVPNSFVKFYISCQRS